MILVVKPAGTPAALKRGTALTAADCLAFDAHPTDYTNGRRKFDFRKTVYGDGRVKTALKRAQHGKCCFCEAQFDANYKGDVEHFRPKGAARDSNGRRILPGYYWLAYCWPNLYYACADCNQYRKRDQFPLQVEANRALNHHDDIGREEPLLLDPGGPVDPRDHIRFKQDVPTWTSVLGETTVRTLKLDREPLNLRRRRHLNRLNTLQNVIRLLASDPRPEAQVAVAEARAELAQAVLPQAEFAAVSQDFLAGQSGK
jgi:uncharacterized protein (TIGR02646 family)